MKASELIAELQDMILKHGDQNVFSYDYADEAYELASPSVHLNEEIVLLDYGPDGCDFDDITKTHKKGFEIG